VERNNGGARYDDDGIAFGDLFAGTTFAIPTVDANDDDDSDATIAIRDGRFFDVRTGREYDRFARTIRTPGDR